MEDPSKDHRWMLNVTSSASVNSPPPNALVTALTKTNKAGKVNSTTREKMVRLFSGSDASPSDKLMPQRNWCAAYLEPPSAGGAMKFELRFEPVGDTPDKVRALFRSTNCAAFLCCCLAVNARG